jgi:hypothetical protein
MENASDDDRVIAVLRSSGPRTVIGAASLGIVGAFLLWIAATTPPADIGWLAVMIAFGGVAFWAAFELYRAAQENLELTRQVLRTSGGRVICRVADVKSVERGALAFKPSGGFLIHLSARQPFAWAPGIWWRWRRMVGIGGVTRGAEARAMAEILELVLADRVRPPAED